MPPAHPGSPGKGPLNRRCCCCCHSMYDEGDRNPAVWLVEGGGHVSQLAQADQCRSGSSADEEAAGTCTVIAWTDNESVPIQLTQCWFLQGWPFPMGNESVPKIIINDAINLFFWNCNEHFDNFKPYQFPNAVWYNCLRMFYLKLYLYFSIGNGQSREPALCQLYRQSFVPYELRRLAYYVRVVSVPRAPPLMFTFQSTQHCVHHRQLSLASPGVAKSSTSFGCGKGVNATCAGWQVTLFDPMRHVSSRSCVATLRTAIHFLLTYLLKVQLLLRKNNLQQDPTTRGSEPSNRIWERLWPDLQNILRFIIWLS